MLSWVIIFFVLAVIAAVFGFGGLAATFGSIAQILFGLFVILFVISLIYYIATGRKPPPPTDL